MRYLKKLVKVGGSYALVIPKEWLTACESYGYSTVEVLVMVGDEITITPVTIPKKVYDE
jgi:antitoxin component of MazEF toxin-antitoxin module